MWVGRTAPGPADAWGPGWSLGASASGMFPWAFSTGMCELAGRFGTWAKLLEQEALAFLEPFTEGETSTAADVCVTGVSAPKGITPRPVWGSFEATKPQIPVDMPIGQVVGPHVFAVGLIVVIPR